MAKPRPDPAASDPEVEGFLALLAAGRAPKTVEAYSRDLRALGDWLGGPPSKATHDDLERWLPGPAGGRAPPPPPPATRGRGAVVLQAPRPARRAHRQPGRGARASPPPAQAPA